MAMQPLRALLLSYDQNCLNYIVDAFAHCGLFVQVMADYSEAVTPCQMPQR